MEIGAPSEQLRAACETDHMATEQTPDPLHNCPPAHFQFSSQKQSGPKPGPSRGEAHRWPQGSLQQHVTLADSQQLHPSAPSHSLQVAQAEWQHLVTASRKAADRKEKKRKIRSSDGNTPSVPHTASPSQLRSAPQAMPAHTTSSLPAESTPSLSHAKSHDARTQRQSVLETCARQSSANSSSLENASDAAAPEQLSPEHAQGGWLMDSIDGANSGGRTPSHDAAGEMQSDSAEVCAPDAEEGVSPCASDLSKEKSISASDVSREISGTEANRITLSDSDCDMANENASDHARGFDLTRGNPAERVNSAGISQPGGPSGDNRFHTHSTPRQNSGVLLNGMGMRRRSRKTTQSASTAAAAAASQQSMACLPHTPLSQALHTHVTQHSGCPGAVLGGASHAATSSALDDMIDLTKD